ncbi:MAG: heavy metal translocating P-type ATPase [Fimbriimonadaceae bacterium]
MPTNEYTITQMDCPTEEQIIRNRLGRVKGVRGLEFDLMQRRLRVEHEFESDKPIRDALRSVGMDPSEKAVDLDALHRRQTVVIGTALVLAFLAEAVTWATGQESGAPTIALAVTSIVICGYPVLKKAWASVRTLTLNINFLMTLAVVGALALGFWAEAAMVISLFALAEAIESRSLERANRAVRSLMDLTPPTALVRGEDGEFKDALVGEVAVGDTVRVRPGERIAFDGTVVHGDSDVDQAPITGESLPVTKKAGDELFAGTLNGSGSLDYSVTHPAGETMLDRIVATVQDAQAQRAPMQRFVDRFARVYTPAIVGLALLVAVVPPVFGALWRDSIYMGLVLLVVACPCALVISTPVTVVSGLARAARLGVVIKGGVHLENGARVTDVAFDKTGTLTEGRPAVTDVEPIDGASRERVLQVAAAVESRSGHPVAKAIIAAHRGPNVEATGFQSFPGLGASALVEGETYRIGNHRWIHDSGYCSTELEAKLARYEAQGKTTSVIVRNSTPVAVLAIADVLRETTAEAVGALHAIGVRTHLVTGDNEATASTIARAAGVQSFRSEMLPSEKLDWISALSKTGVVAMVGDGVNDAPALARADIGIAMGFGGNDTAVETADVALMNDDLRTIPAFLRLCRATATVLKQNIFLSVAIKGAFIIVTFLGYATLWMAVFADMGVSLLVVANGMRLLRFRA